MGQPPVVIRIRVVKPDAAHEEHVVVGVAEAARRLKVSERTVYRMLKSGELERNNLVDNTANFGRDMSDINRVSRRSISRSHATDMSKMSDISGSNGAGETVAQVELLTRQVGEKDAQIAHLLATQGELTRAIQRLQEQMYELAHLVLTHNAAAAQAKAEAELKAQQEQAKRRSGLAGLLGSRSRK